MVARAIKRLQRRAKSVFYRVYSSACRKKVYLLGKNTGVPVCRVHRENERIKEGEGIA